MTLLDAGPIGSQTPAHRQVPQYSETAADEAVELAAAAGLVLDPWEELVLRDSLGLRPDGRWAAFQVALVVPRQNGKGAVLEARALAGLFLFGEELITWSAHEFKTAVESFRRLRRLVEDNRDFAKKVKLVRTASGQEGIELRTGQRVRFMARSRSAGRGFSGDTVILDEAYDLGSEALAASMPTMSARPNPQLWFTSSAPLATHESAVLRRICKRGRAGSPGLAYLEWCAPEGSENDDVEALAAANPGLGIRLNMDVINGERDVLEPDDFARERLGVWYDLADLTEHVIAPEDWELCREPGSKRVGPVAFSFDVAPDRSSASIAAAGVSVLGARSHVEVVKNGPGTGWVVPMLVALRDKHQPVSVVCDASGPAGGLLSQAAAAGLEVQAVSVREHAQACGGFYDAAVDHELAHIGQDVLDRAVSLADRRSVGDAWLWSRKTVTVDISPLVAVTLAKWAWEHAPTAEASADIW